MLAVATIVFLVMRVAAGDPAIAILGEYASAESLAMLRAKMGLDQPLWSQYISYMRDLLHGHLGCSLINNKPVASYIASLLPYTAELAAAGMAIGVIIGVPLGVLTALRPRSLVDYLGRIFALAGLSMPAFYLGILLLLVFALRLHWFPVIGVSRSSSLLDGLRALFLPALSLGLIKAAFVSRMTRSTMLEILGEDFVRTARAKGLREGLVIYRHAFRNALIPVVTVIGIYMGALLGGAVLTETVFNRPGIGKLLVGALRERDYPVIQSTLMMFASFVVIVNLAVDLLYGLIDPRIRYE
jgi:ABC-type dipeptide/oligopeptide/nickel transport system permease component